jgi:hypothetical protein
VPYEYVSRFFEVSGQDYVTGEYEVADKRGEVFYIKGREESMDGALYVFMNGWSCLKFNNIPHDQTEEEFLPTAGTTGFSNVDFPMIRLAEIYLIYAEACMHAGGDASAQIAALRDRAGVPAPAVIDADFIMAERARELMWEAHRRTDLIRLGLYDTDTYMWPYKGSQSFVGQPFGEHMRIFPIPPTELATNKALKQNPGY